MKRYKLVGHSGCRLEVRERDGVLMVVKIAPSDAYGHRLRKQYEKQRAFKSDIFRVPATFQSRVNDEGLFEFEMEYVNGATLAEYLKEAPISAINEIADKFISLIPRNVNFDPDAKQVFATKISDLRAALASQTDPTIERVLNKLQAHEWNYCMKGEGHGDLSLENIIWKDGDLYLIDFLDSFYDGWMTDISKLLFDLECLWSYRHELPADENLRIRILILKNRLLEDIRLLPESKAVLDSVYHMILLHLVRILPYTHEEKTWNHLLVEAGKICDIIDSNQ